MFLFKELTPRIVGEAFYNGEFENELKRIGRIDWRDRESYMAMIEEMRRQSIYPHQMCTQECKQKGIIQV